MVAASRSCADFYRVMSPAEILTSLPQSQWDESNIRGHPYEGRRYPGIHCA